MWVGNHSTAGSNKWQHLQPPHCWLWESKRSQTHCHWSEQGLQKPGWICYKSRVWGRILASAGTSTCNLHLSWHCRSWWPSPLEMQPWLLETGSAHFLLWTLWLEKSNTERERGISRNRDTKIILYHLTFKWKKKKKKLYFRLKFLREKNSGSILISNSLLSVTWDTD